MNDGAARVHLERLVSLAYIRPVTGDNGARFETFWVRLSHNRKVNLRPALPSNWHLQTPACVTDPPHLISDISSTIGCISVLVQLTPKSLNTPRK